MSRFQELLRKGLAHGAVVRAHLKGNPHALHFDTLLIFPTLSLSLVLLVLVLAVVEEAAHGRDGDGVDLHEVKALDARLAQRFTERDDANLPPVGADEANLPRANALVDAETTASAEAGTEETTTLKNGG